MNNINQQNNKIQTKQQNIQQNNVIPYLSNIKKIVINKWEKNIPLIISIFCPDFRCGPIINHWSKMSQCRMNTIRILQDEYCKSINERNKQQTRTVSFFYVSNPSYWVADSAEISSIV